MLLDRIQTRTTNPFGRTAAERQRILDDLEHVEPLLRTSATAEIVTDRPVPDIADEIEALARGPIVPPRGPRGPLDDRLAGPCPISWAGSSIPL